ncbi:MAG: C-GCAxxG-C-C family protein [Eubacteriales bacterium]|nr:C-GCAxxG-C-C family protein [Eubacteriales bacterium]
MNENTPEKVPRSGGISGIPGDPADAEADLQNTKDKATDAPPSRADRAQALFFSGFNCAQSVAGAFADVTGLPEELLLRAASPFGGGFGRQREVCGAISGLCLVLGLCYGYDDPKADGEKAALYRDTQALCAAFRARFGSLLCRELLSGAAKSAPSADLLQKTEPVSGVNRPENAQDPKIAPVCAEIVKTSSPLTARTSATAGDSPAANTTLSAANGTPAPINHTHASAHVPDNSPTPTPRDARFYHERPCAAFVRAGAQLLEAYLLAHPLPDRS